MKDKAMAKKKPKKKVVGFKVLENDCIWMKAGVVNFRLCDNAYDCYSCAFDQAMRKAMGPKSPAKAKEMTTAMKKRIKAKDPAPPSVCRHYLSGRLRSPKICPMNYECSHCPFDLMPDDADPVKSVGQPFYSSVFGFRMADEYYYHFGHTWAHVEHGGMVRVGFDSFLTKIFYPNRLTNFVHEGAALKQGENCCTFSRNEDHWANVLSPVSGVVLATNPDVREHPEIVRKDPYGEGWLYIMEPEILEDNLKGMFYGDESAKWMEMEAQRLLEVAGEDFTKMAATGGEIIDNPIGQFPNIRWSQLVNDFLRT